MAVLQFLWPHYFKEKAHRALTTIEEWMKTTDHSLICEDLRETAKVCY